MKRACLLAISICPLLFGCVVGGTPSHVRNSLEPCEQTQLDCIVSHNSGEKVEELKTSEDVLPVLGLALSGGGSKAAPFAMGVIKRFVDEGWIYKTDYLTSVSGSGYAAFYLYYRAYKSVVDAVPPSSAYPGLSRYFLDTRNLNERVKKAPFVQLFSPDSVKSSQKWYSLAEYQGGCTGLEPEPHDAGTPLAYPHGTIWSKVHQDAYQGWVECYQDLLRQRPVQLSKYKNGIYETFGYDNQLAGTFSIMFAESLATAPVNWFTNVLFDWKVRTSPTQYQYIDGIMRTYGYMPREGDALPVSPNNEYFRQMVKCLDFSDMSVIYSKDDATRSRLGGYLPKWIIQSTANSGNVGLDLSPKHYNLATDVFEITFDGYGSGRYGYVRGSPALVGLTVPMAILASAAFADTAQRSFNAPRGAVNFVLQAVNLRWGFDIANYNEPDSKRMLHSFLIWPFYYIDSPVTGQAGPTIHLSDGGQTGDNLGMVPLLRRGVKNIVVAAGEQDEKDGAMLLGSLCSANYYLNTMGYTMNFAGNPTHAPNPADEIYELSKECTWDGNRSIYVHPDRPDKEPITPFNWKHRVWVGEVVPYQPGVDGQPPLVDGEKMVDQAMRPAHLDGIRIYYINSAMDRPEWLKVVHDWFPPAPAGAADPFGSKGRDGAPAVCKGVVKVNGVDYDCPLIEYFADMDYAVEHLHQKWVFPQTTTAFTTYSSSINLFRAYRDLGWLYAGDLPKASPDLNDALTRKKNEVPEGWDTMHEIQKARYPKDPQVCKDWNG